jgi:hypothetical protein
LTEAEPCRKVACIAECLGRRSQDGYRLGDRRPDLRNGHRATRYIVLFGPESDLGIELPDLYRQLGESAEQHL